MFAKKNCPNESLQKKASRYAMMIHFKQSYKFHSTLLVQYGLLREFERFYGMYAIGHFRKVASTCVFTKRTSLQFLSCELREIFLGQFFK